MQIANPIYDIVFKYLMDDNKVAKLMISSIIEEDIIELQFLPKERHIELEKQALTVYRLDFSAKIKTKAGYKQVIIEIQKAKYPTDIMRFRRYLGEQYLNENNAIKRVEDNGKERKEAIPILSIYLLGHTLEHTNVPVIMVKRNYTDRATRQEIKEREEFIESLTHDSVIIQIPYLKAKRRNELEKLLSIFDQSNRTSDQHILQIKEEDYPLEYRDVIRRLQRAIEEPKVRDNMDMEDEIVEELEDMERVILRKSEIIMEKEKIIEENKKAIEENKKVIEEKDKAIEENKKILEEKDRLIEELKKKIT
ncbi:MAG: hypothetical protein V1872_06075 [bacterium]